MDQQNKLVKLLACPNQRVVYKQKSTYSPGEALRSGDYTNVGWISIAHPPERSAKGGCATLIHPTCDLTYCSFAAPILIQATIKPGRYISWDF